VSSQEIKRTAAAAGRPLDEALAKAGIDHEAVYVTNVVKDFKWTASGRGKRRIHKKPRYSEIQACRPWLDAANSCLPGRDCSTGTPGKNSVSSANGVNG
jgi:hypothetical protein